MSTEDKARLQWVLVALVYYGITAGVYLAFGADLTNPGFVLGSYVVICIFWTCLIQKCASEKEKS